VTILEKDLRPISLTPCISKVAEEFIVEDYVKPAIIDIIDASQKLTWMLRQFYAMMIMIKE
jgi:hypothetical protein